MPTYTYRREDGSTFDIQQRITEPALETCPDTGQPVTRVINGTAGLIFKGSGFYLTDYARTKSSAGGSNGSAQSKETKESSPGAEAAKSEASSTPKK